MTLVQTGVRVFDAALAGGFTPGTSLLLIGEEGAGATEFALAFARHAAKQEERRVRILSALRSPSRVASEVRALFEGAESSPLLDIRSINVAALLAEPASILEGLDPGSIVLIESADALARAGDASELPVCWRTIADRASDLGILVMLLHSPGTLPPAVEVALAEEADGVLRFAWHEMGPSRRRSLSIVKLRGLAPVLDGAEVPVFEVALHRGVGFSLSRGRSVL